MNNIILLKALVIALLSVASVLSLGGEGVTKVSKPLPLKRIVGGNDVNPDSYSRPYQVALFLYYEHDRGFCGGVLISTSLVLTAGHCNRNVEDGEVFRYLVVLGAYNINISNEVGTVRIETTEVVLHPNYNETTLENNLAILLLPHAVDITIRIRPINFLPENEWDQSHVNFLATVSGWGRSEARLSLTRILQEVSVQVIRNDICTTYFAALISDDMLCTSGLTGISTCQGDSGGPLTIERQGQDTLIGIVSFTTKSQCGDANLSVFVRVAKHMNWILEVISDYGISE